VKLDCFGGLLVSGANLRCLRVRHYLIAHLIRILVELPLLAPPAFALLDEIFVLYLIDLEFS